ncbi:MAG TPA: Ig-like domain-containing protein [Gemmatimonadaceae bacterium]|nr:Ig-like domain-containing protein [Gemmatimonadaceae bacterium]
MTVGDTAAAVALFVNSGGSVPVERGIKWMSTNTTILDVEGDGTVVAKKKGSAFVVARWHGATARARATVVLPTQDAPPPTLPDTGSTVTPPDTSSVSKPDSTADAPTDTTKAPPDTTTNTPPDTTTSNAPDDATIPASVTVSPSSITLDKGAQGRLSAKVMNSSGALLSGQTITWSSSNSAVATVSGSGLVTAAGAGQARITARAGSVSGSATITVNNPPEEPPPPRTGSGSTVSDALSFDRFANYAGDAELLSAYLIAHNPELLHLDRSVQWNGHATMRYDQPGGSSATPQVHRSLPHAVRDLWFRGSYRFSPGWSTKGSRPPSETAEAYKWFAIGWSGGASLRQDIVFTNTDDIEVGAALAQDGKTLFASKAQMSSDASFMWNGGWYTLVVHAVAQGSTATMEAWLLDANGTVVKHQSVRATTSDGRTVPAMDRIMLGMNFNDTRYPDQTQSLWLGQWEVVDGAQHPNPFGVQ